MTKKAAKYPIPIREWSEDDRPREKLLKYGEHTLSNAELLAIMIRTGAPGKSAVDIGRELLHKFKSLRSMSGVDTSEFKKITGLKNAKTAQIKAAIELGRRMLSEEKALEGPVKSSADVFTKSLMMAAKATGISFFDHIIIGDNQYFSFADEGLIGEYKAVAIREL